MAASSGSSSRGGGSVSKSLFRAVPELCITEQWIRERLNLQLDSLESVRSLALPGSYSEKITHLGRSLVGFSRLKHLDLSRNAITSLEGIDHLKHLETLNLYYNNVASLTELFRLRSNARLVEVDLRLNPVTKNEPDYRLFMVHMLTSLRKLDERGVRDSERKAALMHFDTDQAYELAGGAREDDNVFQRRSQLRTRSDHIEARAKLVHSLAKRPTALEDDTDALLDLIAKNDDLLSPAARKHSRARHHNPTPSRLVHSTPSPPPPLPPPTNHRGTGILSNEFGHEATDAANDRESYSDFKVKFNFTPAPATESRERLAGDEEEEEEDEEEGKQKHWAGEVGSSSAVEQLLQLLNGCIPEMKSRRVSREVKSQLGQWLLSQRPVDVPRPPAPLDDQAQLQADLDTLQQHLQLKDTIIHHKDLELSGLHERLQAGEEESAAVSKRLQQTTSELETARLATEHLAETQQLLQQAHADLSALRQQFQSLEDENSALQTAAESAPSSGQVGELHTQIDQLRKELGQRKRELEQAEKLHRQDTESSSQLQELTAMLQESHRSLVATNDHLLLELEDTRQRHTEELLQMNSNYVHLRRTVDLVHTA